MNQDHHNDAEIALDLSKLLGFQGLDVPGDETDLAKVMNDTHNKVGEVPPDNDGGGQT